MATAAFHPAQETTLERLSSECFRREPLFAGAALLLAVLTLPLLVAYALDGRELLGVNVWTKPIKFSAALIVYLGTLAWFAGWLPASTTASRWYPAFSGLVVACVTGEMAWIVGAAASGTASHFNTTVPFLTNIYPVMGILAVILTSATLVYGILIARDADSRLAPAFRLSVALGLVMTFVATVFVAGYMASRTGHSVGASGTDAGGLALMGWSRTGGDLRIAHFFATHAMHTLPFVGFLAGLLLPATWGRGFVIVAGLGYASLIGYTFALALMGQPFLPFLRL